MSFLYKCILSHKVTINIRRKQENDWNWRIVSESKMHLPHSFKAAATASSIKGLLKQVGTGSGGCTSTTRDPGNPKASRVCTIEKASRVFPYTSALPRIRHDTPSVILQTNQLTVPSQFLRYAAALFDQSQCHLPITRSIANKWHTTWVFPTRIAYTK